MPCLDLRTLGEHVPVHGCRKPAQIKARIWGNARMLLSEERLNVVLARSLVAGLELGRYKLTRLLHSRKTKRYNGPVKVYNLKKVAMGRHAVADPLVLVVEILVRRLGVHDIVPVEVVVRETKRALSIRKGKDDLRHPRRLFLGLRVLLNQIIKRPLKLLHNGCDHGHILESCPCKRLVFSLVVQSLFRYLGGTVAREDFVFIVGAVGAVVVCRERLGRRIAMTVGPSRRLTDVVHINVGDEVVQVALFPDDNSRTLGAGMLELCSTRRLPQFEVKRRAEIVGKPRTFRKLFVVVADINRVGRRQSGVDTVHFREVNAARLGKNNGRQGTHISRRVGALKLGLHIGSDGFGFRKAKDTVVAAHPLERAQQHGCFAMDRNRGSFGCADMGFARDRVDALRQPNAIVS